MPDGTYGSVHCIGMKEITIQAIYGSGVGHYETIVG